MWEIFVIDIGILDNGISIPLNFENHRIPFKEDSHAILKAVKGTSTKKEFNRGYGLLSSFKIVTDGLKGEFYIFSRKGVVLFRAFEKQSLYKLNSLILNGTFAYIRFHVPSKPINIETYL